MKRYEVKSKGFGGKEAGMDKIKDERVDLSLNNEEFFSRYGHKKIISTCTLG
ncbi:MAG: hypothetical protein ACYDG2_04650 [Ruminiclostridium sp.]